MIWTLTDLVRSARSNDCEIRPGVWVPARPYPAPFVVRLRGAWLVLTGRADAVVWPGGQ